MVITKFTTAFVFISLLLISGCKREASKLKFKKVRIMRGNDLLWGEASLSYESLRQYILKPKCMSCHSGAEAKPKNDPIDFSSYEIMMKDRFIPILIKGKPTKSRLYKSVFEGKMPKDYRLSNIEIEFIRKWIKSCAPNEPVDTIPENCKSGNDDDDDFGDDDF